MKFRDGRIQLTVYLAGGLFIAAFAAMALGILAVQQRIVGVTHETRDVMVPQFLAQIRVVRNLEGLRHYGSLAVKGADPQVRRDAAYLAALIAAHPSSQSDEATRALVAEANGHVQSIVAGVGPAVAWPPMEDLLTARADALSVATGNLVLERATDIRDDSLLVRNLATALAVLFVSSMVVMVFLGRSLVVQLRTKNQFFNEASHDFRQRLHGMQLLINTAQRTPLHNAPAIVSKVKAATADLQRYLDNFLELTRLEAVVVRPVFNPVVLQDVFQRLELQFEEAASHRQVDLKFRYTRASVHSDERILLRLLENLISNAIKFARGRVLVAARPRLGRLEIWVMDDGEGMPELPQLGLFEAFVQGSNAKRVGTSDHGFGLGLSIVMRAASLLSARVQVRTQGGRGSTVKVVFKTAVD
ncbi:MAG: HAMP domain-containing sensor histidine kinase [Pseudomonadota bacterium]